MLADNGKIATIYIYIAVLELNKSSPVPAVIVAIFECRVHGLKPIRIE
jgi:hypothetical protein